MTDTLLLVLVFLLAGLGGAICEVYNKPGTSTSIAIAVGFMVAATDVGSFYISWFTANEGRELLLLLFCITSFLVGILVASTFRPFRARVRTAD